MGQRLIVNIINQQGILTSGYYHWSGYTLPSVRKTLELIDELEEDDPKGASFTKLDAIRLLESTGAGLTQEEKKVAQTKYPDESFADAVDRTRGLIKISEEEIERNDSLMEELVTVNVETERILFDVFSYFEQKEELEKLLQETLPNPSPRLSVDPTQIMDFDTFRQFAKEIEPIISNQQYFIEIDNEYIEMIGAIQ